MRLGLGDPPSGLLKLALGTSFRVHEIVPLTGGLSFRAVCSSPFGFNSSFSRRLLFTGRPRPVVCGLGFRLGRY
jgi:hypothetical protein